MSGTPAQSVNAASIDRVNSSRGYELGNVRVISDRANSLRSNATLEELRALVEDSAWLEFLG